VKIFSYWIDRSCLNQRILGLKKTECTAVECDDINEKLPAPFRITLLLLRFFYNHILSYSLVGFLDCTIRIFEQFNPAFNIDDMIRICLRSIVVSLTHELQERAVFLSGQPSKNWPPSKVCAMCCENCIVVYRFCQVFVIATRLGNWLLVLHLVIAANITGHDNFL
jgi:hypothetical protein